MNLVSRALRAAGILLAVQATAVAQSAAPPTPIPAWPVATAPARFDIERIPSYPVGLIGWVDLNLPDPKWETMPLRVFTDTGVPVASDLIWTAPGEPATLVFDSSANARKYQVYVGSTWPPLHLTDRQIGVWLETREGDGTVITKAADMLEAWKKAAGKVVGRALTTGIFEAGNRFGPQGNLFLHFQGWFELDKPMHLDFAILSCDSTFVFVDGKEVVEWTGIHDWRTPPSGPPQGGVDLAAGRHGIDYYNAFVGQPGGSQPILCTLAAKGGALTDWTQLRTGSPFYRPATAYQVIGYDLPPGAPVLGGAAPPVAIKRGLQTESLINADFDIGFIAPELTALGPITSPLTWTFDDGGSAQGQVVKHLFARPGLHTVHISTEDGGKTVPVLTETILVRPMTVGLELKLRPDHETDILGRDPAAMSTSDLVSCFALFANYQNWDDVLRFLPALCAKMSDAKDADLSFLRDATMALVHNDRAHYAEEIQLLRALLDRAGQGNPAPEVVVAADRVRLALARLLLTTSDQTDDVGKLLDAIHPGSLTGDEPRALAMLRADLALATGDVAGAKKQYTDLTGQPTGPDVRSSIRRTAKVGQARAFIDQKDYDSAEDALHEVAWNAPIEKLSPDWALTELRLKQAENLSVPAYIWAKRLLPVIKGNDRSELLFRLTDLALAQNDLNLAHKTLTELLEKFPYSAEAAQAKEKWPGAESEQLPPK